MRKQHPRKRPAAPRPFSAEGQLAVEQILARKGASGTELDGPQMVALALVEIAEALREWAARPA